MDIEKLRTARIESTRALEIARSQGQVLEREFIRLLDRVQPGHEDPVLLHLIGALLGDQIRRTNWSTLVINPGSTSTKVAIYVGLKLVAQDEVKTHTKDPDGVTERVEQIVKWVETLGLDFTNLTGIAARGGFLAPVPQATYRVTEKMCIDLENAPYRHASSMAVPMAIELGKLAGPDVVLTTTDPVSCDDVDTQYRLTGSPKIRTDGSGTHYLNLRAVCTLAGELLETAPARLHLIACHMGGGMSAARYKGGRMVQVLPALGTFPSANRSGNLPLKDLIRLVDERKYDFEDLRADVVNGQGGLMGLTGTDDLRQILAFRKSEADPRQREKIDLVLAFFTGRIAAGIMELAATSQPLDGIILTGGLSKSPDLCAMIMDRIPLAVPIWRVPGSLESQSLAAGLYRAAGDPISRHNYVEARDDLAKKRATEDALFETKIFAPPKSHSKSECLDTLAKVVSAARELESVPTVAIIGGDNEETLIATRLANPAGSQPMARFVLLGNFARISDLAWELDIPIDEETFFIVDADDPVEQAMELYRNGIVDTVMKGSVSTAQVLKGYLKSLKQMGKLRSGVVLSHVGLCQLSGRDRVVAVTDAAINPEPDVKTRSLILENALYVLQTLGFTCPKVAVIAPTEKTSAKVASTLEGEELELMYKDRKDVIVEGPISVDLALSAESAEDKRYEGIIKGDADILLVPNLDVGNAVYKSFTVTGDATVAATVVGCGAPLILTSRGDSSQTKFASIALALVLAGREGVA